MKPYTLGFVGAGNMAQAIINGAIKATIAQAKQIHVYDVDEAKTKGIAQNLGVHNVRSIAALCESSDIVVLAVKPNVIAAVLEDIKIYIGSKPVVSIAAGWSADMIAQIIGTDKCVCRLMPNTPLMVGEGMSVFEIPCSLPKEEMAFIEHIFSSLGAIAYAPQKAMDAVTAVSGSGPAYVFMFIEALSDAGVLCGLPREQATLLAAQTVMGAAKMVLETGSHPGVLKDAVCSPGGTTIEAVKSLEHDGFRGTVIKAVEKSAKKSKMLSQI